MWSTDKLIKLLNHHRPFVGGRGGVTKYIIYLATILLLFSTPIFFGYIFYPLNCNPSKTPCPFIPLRYKRLKPIRCDWLTDAKGCFKLFLFFTFLYDPHSKQVFRFLQCQLQLTLITVLTVYVKAVTKAYIKAYIYVLSKS